MRGHWVLILIFLDIFFYLRSQLRCRLRHTEVLILIFLDIFFYMSVPSNSKAFEIVCLNPYFLGYLFLPGCREPKWRVKSSLNPYFLGYLFLHPRKQPETTALRLCLNPYFLGYLFLPLYHLLIGSLFNRS